MEEVKLYTRDSVGSALIPLLDGGVIKSDVRVDTTTNLALKKAAHVLRRSIEDDEEILDLVDPFVFPFAWEKTRLLRKGSIRAIDCITTCGEGEPAKMPPEDDCKEPDHGRYRNDMAYSRRFQWLPFDVVFDNDGLGRSRYVGRDDEHVRIQLTCHLCAASKVTSITSTHCTIALYIMSLQGSLMLSFQYSIVRSSISKHRDISINAYVL